MNISKLVMVAVLGCLAWAPEAFAQFRLHLPATQAAYVNGREKKSNFGKTEILEVKKSKTGKQDRHCYLQFDLSKTKTALEITNCLRALAFDNARTALICQQRRQMFW